MEIDATMLQLLMETGYVACGRGLYKEAETIFDGISAVRPASEYPLIGKAVVKINSGDCDGAAVELREKILKNKPDCDLAKSFLGLSLMLSGRAAESEKVFREILENGTDEAALEMARNMT